MSLERDARATPPDAAPQEGAASVVPDFRAVFRGLPGNYLVLAPDAPRFTMLEASDERLASTLSTREATLGQPLFDVFSDANPENPEPSGVENLRASLDTVLRTRARHRMAVQRYDLRRPDGTWEVRYWAPENVPILGPDGAVRYIVHHVEDVTGRVLDRQATEVAERARERAEVAEGRLRDVLEQTTVAIAVLTGPEHVFSIVSPAYAESPGHGRPLLGLAVRDAFPELAGTGYPETMDHVFETGEPFSASERRVMLRNRDGVLEEHYFNVGYQPLRDATGAVYAIASVAYDVTAQVRARQDVETARQAADHANQAKTEFLSAMSHELRTPLNAILGYADLLEQGVRGALSESQHGDIARIRRAGQHLLCLITDVLNYARIEAGRVHYDIRDVLLDDIVADVEGMITPQLQARGLTFAHDACAPDTPDRPHRVRADPEKVRQILINLLSNAIKFTPPGGHITLQCDSVARSAESSMADSTTDGENPEPSSPTPMVRLQVSDTGPGIDPARLTDIFEPFVQLDRQRSRDPQQGVGLGLAISRDLARGMGGDLTAESTVGVGSTFTLTLPRA